MDCIDRCRNQDAAAKKKTFIIIGVVLFTLVLLLLLILVLVTRVPRPPDGGTYGYTDRIECPGFTTASECESHGCSYRSVDRGPACYMKKGSFGYKIEKVSDSPGGKVVTLVNRTATTPYGDSLTNVVFEVSYITENIVRAKLYDSANKRYEVPVQNDFPLLKNKPNVDTKKLVYEVSITNNSNTFGFQVKRSDGTVLWDTNIGALVMSDQYLQVASYLPSSNIYGLGEHTHKTLRHDLEYRTWPMFARDRAPIGGEINLYGVHPYYTCLENTSKSHGVLLLNSNAMEVTLLPEPAISFRTIGGILDLFFIVGDNPEHVVQLYTSLIGRPMMPPYWGLGFQLSRYGYNNLENVKAVVERTRNASIAQDVQFLDIDHMDMNKDFTVSGDRFSGLIEYIKKTKEEYDLKWIIILDPAIEALKGYSPYESGVQNKVFIKRSPSWKADMFPIEVQNDVSIYGKVWPNGVVAFPDFLNPSAKDWWYKTITEYHKQLPFDGLWNDMNEPANFGTNEDKPFYCQENKDCWSLKCPTSYRDDPPYNPLKKSGSDRLSQMTLCMDSIQNDGSKNYSHYDVHSLYGWSQTQPTIKAAETATGTRSLLISRSTYPSSGRYAGHWLGDNKSTWDDLKLSIIGMLEFNMFGIPYIGADVCGFFEETTNELCTRWMQLGAFYPFFRNHNGMGEKDQDPAALGEDVKEISKIAVERRYNLQPYLYTLFYRAHVNGSTVIRPLFHEFPKDKNTWNIGEQFMWGSCLLVSPIMEKGAYSVRLYLPEGEEWWQFKNYYGFSSINGQNTPEVPTDRYVIRGYDSDSIPLHVRSGCIIPTEPYRLRGDSDSAKNEIELHVFLRNGEATGEIYIDDGVSKDAFEKKSYAFYKFISKNCSFEVRKEGDGEYPGEEPTLTVVYFSEAQFNGKMHSSTTHAEYVNKKLKDVGLLYLRIYPFTEC